MFIICNEFQADKKAVKKLDKIVISEALEGVKDSKKITHMNQLLPPMDLFHNFINGEFSKKKFMKKFIKHIKNNDQLFASIAMIMLVYKKQKDLVLVCSAEEMRYGYMHAICMLLNDVFKVDIMDYDIWKSKGAKLGKCKFDEKALKEVCKEYSDILFDDGDDRHHKSKKKGKKDKDKKGKKKDKFKELEKGKNKKKSSNKSKGKKKESAGNNFLNFGYVPSQETLKKELQEKIDAYEETMDNLGFSCEDAPIIVHVKRVR